MRDCFGRIRQAWCLGNRINANGTLLPSSYYADAAPQLHQTGHSSIVQHFSGVKVCSADYAEFGMACANALTLRFGLSIIAWSFPSQAYRTVEKLNKQSALFICEKSIELAGDGARLGPCGFEKLPRFWRK